VRHAVACSVAISLLVPMPTARVVAASETGLSLGTFARTTPNRLVVDDLVFSVPLARFRGERSRAKRLHPWLITRTDGCTAPFIGSTGRSFNFRAACERHDLAYANYQSLARLDAGVVWSSELRAQVDDQFQRDLQQSCTNRRHSERLRCDAWAVVYFHAVRVAAGP